MSAVQFELGLPEPILRRRIESWEYNTSMWCAHYSVVQPVEATPFRQDEIVRFGEASAYSGTRSPLNIVRFEWYKVIYEPSTRIE